MSESVLPLNYSAHAIEDLRVLQQTFLQGGAPHAARSIATVIDLLRQSQKFLMPNCCELVDPNDLRQAHLDLMRPPYPVVTFEAPWMKSEPDLESIGGIKQTRSTKRIALCWEAAEFQGLFPEADALLQRFAEGGVCVVPIYFQDSAAKWLPGMGGAFIPYGAAQRLPAEIAGPGIIANEALRAAGRLRKNAFEFRCEPFVILTEPFAAAVHGAGSKDQAMVHLILDSRDEVQMLVQACAVLNCANIRTAHVDPPTPLNKKRVANGKQPFFSYKVLQVSDERGNSGEPAPGGGGHSSPRMHLRRGHLRRLQTKVVWVRPSTVNAVSRLGVVAKDYEVVKR